MESISPYFTVASDKWASFCLLIDDFAQPAIINETMEKVGAAAGISAPEAKMFIAILAAYPVAFIWKQLPGQSLKHVFSVSLGLWLLQYLIGYQWIHIIISSMLCYFSMLVFGPKARYFTAGLALFYLAGGHIYRQYTDYLGWTLDWTMQHMVVCQKLSALAFNHYDGTANKAPTEEQQKRAVKKVPSVLQFLSFILYPGNLTIGPAFEFSDYINVASGAETCPLPFLPAMIRLGKGLSLLVAHQAIAMYFPIWYLLTDEKALATGNLFFRYAKIWVGLLGHRFKYYFGWKIAEGAACMSGLGYAGAEMKEDKVVVHKWDRVENVDVGGYEFSQSLRDSSAAWNKTTNLWLRRYVYDRFPSSINLYVTYLVSAFWHGFYPGYYMFFMSIAFATSVHRNIRRVLRPRFMQADGKTPGQYKWLYDVMSMVVTNLTTNYFIFSFVVLAWNLSVNAFKSVYFVGHIILASLLAIFSTGLIRPPKSVKPAAENAKKQN